VTSRDCWNWFTMGSSLGDDDRQGEASRGDLL
jgi:hypothetical protein